MFRALSIVPSSLYLLSILPRILAADCYEGFGVDPDVSNAWQLREQVCGNNACANSDTARGDNHFCSIFLPFNNGKSQIHMQRNDPVGKFENCWGATKNIITQCFDNQGGPGITGDPNGSWKWGDEWYWVAIHHNSVNDPSGEEYSAGEEKYMYGPNQFCQGLGPGGGESCVNIPDNCYIEVPLSNTIPDVLCPIPSAPDE